MQKYISKKKNKKRQVSNPTTKMNNTQLKTKILETQDNECQTSWTVIILAAHYNLADEQFRFPFSSPWSAQPKLRNPIWFLKFIKQQNQEKGELDKRLYLFDQNN